MLFVSRFAHSYEKGDVVIWYHAFKMQPVYLEKARARIVEDFAHGAVMEDVLRKYGEGTRPLCEALQDAKILVSSEDDVRALEHFRHHAAAPSVSIAYFILTDKCNFACSYCFVKNAADVGYVEKVMTPETGLAGLDTFCRLIARDPLHADEEKTIIFYGGEPLLNQRVLHVLLDAIELRKTDKRLPEKTSISMVTNGSVMTRDIARLLKRHGVTVSISLDGDELTTNACRKTLIGEPVYQKIRAGIQICKEEGVDLGISCTLSPESVKNFDATLRTLVDDVGIQGLGFNLAMATPQFPLPKTYPQEASECIIKAFQLFRERGIYEDRAMRKINSFADRHPHLVDCGASGAGQIVIATDGQIGVCHGYVGARKHFTAHTVADADFDPDTDPIFQEWRKRSPVNMPQCLDCPALGICGGGCPFQADLEKGSIWEIDERFCVHSKMTLEWILWDLYARL